MAASLQNGDIWRVVLNGTLGLSNRFVHFHIGLTYQFGLVTGSGATDLDLANHADANYGPPLKLLMGNNAIYNSATTRRLVPNVNRPVFQQSTTNSGVGSAGAVMLPAQTAGLISLYTNLMGRANRGRLYIPFPSASDDQASGSPTAGYVTRLQNFAALMLTDLSVNGTGSIACNLVVFHKKLLTATVITTTISRSVWATDRRRGAYRPPRRIKHPV